jgi:hypothetical protein
MKLWNGLAYQTAWRIGRDGKLPVPAQQLPTAIESVAITYECPAPTRKSTSNGNQGGSRKMPRGSVLPGSARYRKSAPVKLNSDRAKIMRLCRRLLLNIRGRSGSLHGLYTQH